MVIELRKLTKRSFLLVGTKYLAGLNLTLVLFSLFAIYRFISCYLPQTLLFRQSSVLKILTDVIIPTLRMKSNYSKKFLFYWEWSWWSGAHWLVDFHGTPVYLSKSNSKQFYLSHQFTYLPLVMIHLIKNCTNVLR